MLKFYNPLLIGLVFLATPVALLGQNSFFSDMGENRIMPTNGQRQIIPEKFRTSSLDFQAMKNFLWSLPSENAAINNRNQMPVLTLPMPDGSLAKFRVWENGVLAPRLKAKFPDIKTFTGQGIDDPSATIQFDLNPYFGFRAQILSPNGRIYIDPYAKWDISNYISYYHRDNRTTRSFTCGLQEEVSLRENMVEAGPCLGTSFRTYRTAITCTGEYAQTVGGGQPAPTHAEIVTAVNRVSGVYEVELSIRLQLIADNNLIEFLDPLTDPFVNDGSIAELNNITPAINAALSAVGGSAAYDIGHLFCTSDNAGVAGLGVVCSTSKGRGLTGGINPVGDGYYIDFVAHEMGHQFDADHTFNSGNCASPGGSYEPGSGTTIMAYAGICSPPENIQPNSDPIFHAFSFDQIGTFVTTGGGSGCANVTPTGNTLPVINTMSNNNLSIPINTPFTLTATASDANGDAITYNWEGWDVGAAGTWPSAANSTTRPLFRTRVSKTTGTRTFPDIRVIAANYPGTGAPSAMDGLRGEVLPLVARTMKFRLTVRDNRALGGGVVSGGEGCQTGFTDPFQVNVVATTGPFAVTAPNGGENYPGGSTQTITWNPVGTEAAPFNVTNVRISLSTDGGLTYPIEITPSTPNDGSEMLTIPASTTTTARIKIEAIGNIFFDISNANFTIAAPAAGFSFNSPAPVSAACPTAGSMQTTLTATYFGGFTTNITLSATGNPGGTTVSFGTNPLTTGSTSSTVTLNNTNTLSPGTYTVTVTGTAGAVIQQRDISFVITAGTGPAITAQPGNQTVCTGGNASFSITSATATAFRWQVSSGGGPFTDLSNVAPYSGVTTNTLNITGVTAGLNGNQYRCVASTLCGSTNSNAATLTVNTAPAITAQPVSQTVCVGSNVNFSVAATGAGLTYQWRKGGVNLANGGNISGATTATLSLTSVIAGDAGNYDVVVTGTCTPPATSATAVLTVGTSVGVTTQPTDQTVCAGGNAGFTVVASGTGIIYQWQVNPGTGFVNVPASAPYSGGTTATLTITGATAGLNGYQYRCQVSNATCTTPGVSNAATLTVNTLPAISANPQNQTLCTGSSVTFNVTASGTGITYQWRKNGANLANGGTISGATSASLTINNLVTGDAGSYDVVVSGTCPPPATSSAAVLTVNAPVLIASQPVNAETCSGSNASFSVTGSGTGILYQWQVNPGTGFVNVPAAPPYSGGTTATLTITGATIGLNGYLYRCLVSNSTCTTPAASSSAVLTVRQLPSVGLTASPLTSLLPGQSTTLTATPTSSTGGTLSTTWSFNGSPITNAGNTRIVTVEQVGAYQVTIRETWPGTLVCSSQSPVVTIDATPSPRLFIFPSPNNGSFTVSYYNASGTATSRTIAIFDSKGGRVYTRSFAIVGPYTLIPVNLAPAQKGVYMVVIGDANGKKLEEGKVVVNQ